jgi:hypothetical protein
MRHTAQPTTQTQTSTNKTSRRILPILFPCREGEAWDGVANFYLITTRDESGTYSRSGPKVRLLRNSDYSDEAAIRKVLSTEDYDLLTGTLDLKRSRETADLALQERANTKLGYNKTELDRRLYSYPAWADVRVPEKATAPMDPARLVLWSQKGRYIPAIYCPDVKTAIFCRAFFNLQTCPHCGIVFFAENDNVIYCRPSHGHAHRMARARYLKTLRERERKQGRKKRNKGIRRIR